jgi:asparagine synthase (glutamine-hydrolysing)
VRFFLCLIHPAGHPVSHALKRHYEALPRSRRLRFQWQVLSQIPVLTGGDDADGEALAAHTGHHVAIGTVRGDDADGEALAAHTGHHVAIGTVRLDNRGDLVRWSGCTNGQVSDLELVLRTVVRHGSTYIPKFLGDFAFVVWNATTRTALAACDAFGLRKLYYADNGGVLAFASRGEVLTNDNQYDAQYLSELVATCVPTPGLTAYASVRSVPPASIVAFNGGRVTARRYWSAYDFDPNPRWASAQVEAVETCRNLLVESVCLRLSGKSETWANLSGGLDSSSVASIVQWLVAQGRSGQNLAGTITYVDSRGTGGDEREYSDIVASHWALRNEKIIDPPVWQDEEHALPPTDQPGVGVVFYPRDCRACAIIRGAGGRVLLTGGGGDTLFTGNMFFFADWVAQGRVWPAVREMLLRAAAGRASFWDLSYRNVVLPLLPRWVQHRLVQDQGQMPSWVHRDAVRKYELHLRASAPLSYAGRVHHKYHDAVAAGVMEIPISAPIGIMEDRLDVRHPYLYRPLVEFALQLPPELCARPYARKWVLREAMRGILPETVRTRIGKGTNHALLAWSLVAQRALLEPLLDDSILADLGIVEAAKLRAAFLAAQNEPDRRDKLHSAVQETLAVEAWLRMRNGRWQPGGHIA